MDLNPNNLIRSNSTEESLLNSNREEFGKEEDDPLSIKGKSLSILGLLLAAMTILLPTFSVLFERPLLHDFSVISNQKVKKDGY